MKIFLTGGAGYIGSHCSALLLEKGHQVLILDNLSAGHTQMIPRGAEFLEGDVTNAMTVSTAFQKFQPEAVMHFAAKASVEESTQLPLYYWEQNLLGTLNLLKAIDQHQVRHIIFSSTAAVYGEPRSIPISEENPTCPVNPYGNSKRSCEKMIQDAAKYLGIHYFILRYFNATGADFGLGEWHDPETHLIPLVLQTALGKREAIKVYGTDYETPDGTCVRDYIHVTDIAKAHVLALIHLIQTQTSGICNIGSAKGFSVLELIEMAREITGRPIKVELSARRPGDPAKLIASHQKAQALLGWVPERDLREIIASAWQWELNRGL